MMKLSVRFLLTMLVLFANLQHAFAEGGTYEFRKVESQEGLSNMQINCLLRDRQGYIWLGTSAGLERYDGFRFRPFYSRAGDERSLLSDAVDEIYEDKHGLLWLHTSLGYCIYNPETEDFDREPTEWMKKMGMTKMPDRLFVDSRKNIWGVVNGKACYFFDAKREEAYAFKMGRGQKELPLGDVTSMAETKNTVVVIYNNGTMARLDGYRKKVLWVNRHIPQQRGENNQDYSLHIDSHSNYWVGTGARTIIYSPSMGRWFATVPQWFKAMGVNDTHDQILVKDILEDAQQRLWIATDHHGLLLFDWRTKKLLAFKKEKDNPSSLPENTIQSLAMDANGALWIGTYKNGAVYYWDYLSIFDFYEIGDVNTITEDRLGNWWLGTNDRGVLCYNSQTGARRVFQKGETGLGTDVIVSSLCAHDGSLWFGTYNGGMAHYHDGAWIVYRAYNSGLANDNVWSLAEDANGNIVIGTLGGGIQILDLKTGRFTTYNSQNSGLPFNFISSVSMSKQGRVLAAHSQCFSILDLSAQTVKNYPTTKSGQPFLSPQMNQILEDTRGLAWIATNSGVNVLDVRADDLYKLNFEDGLGGMVACAIAEDHHGNMWVSTDRGVSRITVSKHEKRWEFSIVTYNYLDGLQKRQFNYRSIFTTRKGDILVGGQDGLNVFPEGRKEQQQEKASVIFSGVVLFDHPLRVGEEYNGHVVLDKALDISRELELEYEDNSFTILLASSTIVVPARKRFYYRLKGFSNKWMLTPPNRPEVTFTNLSPGTYTLEVSIVGRDGHIAKEVSTLRIRVNPPFYLSPWAFLVYALVIGGVLYYAYRQSVRRQREKFIIEQMEREREKDKELDEMKMAFFTNVSHELRTPLTLILQPLGQLVKNEGDRRKRATLEIIHRNAVKLLALVNQLLDFRRMEANRETLNLVTGDIVGFVRGICRSFRLLQDKHIHLTFYSPMESLVMSFDDDKIGKVVNNLLSNAYKFTGSGGRVDVSLGIQSKEQREVQAEDMLYIRVTDTGIGISDEDKKRIFDRFYQVKGTEISPYGGSGVGLSLVKDFVELHDGQVSVKDNAGQGSVFSVYLPIRHDVSLRELKNDDVGAGVESLADEAMGYHGQEGEGAENAKGQGEYEMLLVDDSQDFLDFMSSIMGEKYRLRLAHDGKEALQMINERHPDVIVSDVMMPEMDGIQLCKAVKHNPETEKIPFVLLTARMTQEHKIEGLESGADDYITKPFNIDLLNLRVANLIKWRRNPGKTKIEPKVKELEITSLDEKLVQKATSYVEENIDNADLSVESLSSALNMSRVHLYKKLLSLTGNTPSEFIRLIRLRHAEQLLRQSQLSVAEISYQVGFNNPRYFSKYFKEMYGMMPSQYKEAKKE